MPEVVRALERLGGEACIQEIEDEVISHLGLSDEQLAVRRRAGPSGSQVGYRIAWARTKLRIAGKIERRERAVWGLVRDEDWQE